MQVEIPVAIGGGFTNRTMKLGTDADIKTGQKVAIGKASVDNSGSALILVVSANVVN